MLNELLLDMYDFTCWGRELILEQAAKLTPEQFVQETRFPIKSVRATLAHTLSAESGYYARCVGQPHSGLPETDFPDVASLQARWQVEQEKMRAYLAQVSEAELNEAVTYKTPQGEITRTRILLIKQLFFHSMQHRAELAQMLTEFGYSPGNIDYTLFAMRKQA